MLQIIIAVIGVNALITSRFPNNRGIIVGSRARLIGLILSAPALIGFVMGFIIGGIGTTPQFGTFRQGWLENAQLIELILVIVAMFAATFIASTTPSYGFERPPVSQDETSVI